MTAGADIDFRSNVGQHRSRQIFQSAELKAKVPDTQTTVLTNYNNTSIACQMDDIDILVRTFICHLQQSRLNLVSFT